MFQAQAQQTQLSPSLTIATKESLQKLEEQKQHDIAFYAKNNTPKQEVSTAKPEDDFYQLYITDDNNRYYNNYHNNNTDPIIASMPSPGPNLDYYYVNPNSSGNYDKVVKQQ
ncbi:hypothetical protein HYN59_09670 [Flavobacterium album]|uniref:Uncharacterized protein n=2 Tax=Flavobacterium album TaxID=2175091 RepID=A0A2S1QY73_9FLAO|nr:hypothetical protein HYN59_09670 [Flavobacterium album]